MSRLAPDVMSKLHNRTTRYWAWELPLPPLGPDVKKISRLDGHYKENNKHHSWSLLMEVMGSLLPST